MYKFVDRKNMARRKNYQVVIYHASRFLFPRHQNNVLLVGWP